MKFTQFEPKYNHRYLVKFPIEFNFPEYAFIKVNKPKFTNGKWEPIQLVFVDPIAPSTSQCLFALLESIKDKKEQKILFSFSIQSLDPCGTVIEDWKIHVGQEVSIDFGNLDYSDESIQTPKMIVKPVYCVLNY